MVTQTYMPTQFDEHAELKLTIGSYVSVRSSRYEARGEFENLFLEGFVRWRHGVHNRNIKHARAIEFD